MRKEIWSLLQRWNNGTCRTNEGVESDHILPIRWWQPRTKKGEHKKLIFHRRRWYFSLWIWKIGTVQMNKEFQINLIQSKTQIAIFHHNILPHCFRSIIFSLRRFKSVGSFSKTIQTFQIDCFRSILFSLRPVLKCSVLLSPCYMSATPYRRLTITVDHMNPIET